LDFFCALQVCHCQSSKRKYKHSQNVNIAKAQKNHQHPLRLVIIETNKKSQAPLYFDHHRDS
jgi:hypothetical protein